jgi:hypothetical protein
MVLLLQKGPHSVVSTGYVEKRALEWFPAHSVEPTRGKMEITALTLNFWVMGGGGSKLMLMLSLYGAVSSVHLPEN